MKHQADTVYLCTCITEVSYRSIKRQNLDWVWSYIVHEIENVPRSRDTGLAGLCRALTDLGVGIIPPSQRRIKPWTIQLLFLSWFRCKENVDHFLSTMHYFLVYWTKKTFIALMDIFSYQYLYIFCFQHN